MMLEFSNMVRKKGLKYLFFFVCANRAKEKKRWRFALRATGRHLLVSIQTLVSSFHNSNLSPRFLENALFNLYNI